MSDDKALRPHPGRYRCRDGSIAIVDAFVSPSRGAGPVFGIAFDNHPHGHNVFWDEEGRVSPYYDSRWDLIERVGD